MTVIVTMEMYARLNGLVVQVSAICTDISGRLPSRHTASVHFKSSLAETPARE